MLARSMLVIGLVCCTACARIGIIIITRFMKSDPSFIYELKTTKSKTLVCEAVIESKNKLNPELGVVYTFANEIIYCHLPALIDFHHIVKRFGTCIFVLSEHHLTRAICH